MIHHACDPRRRERVLAAIAEGRPVNGIDFLEVLDQAAPADTPRQRTLLVHFLAPAPVLGPANLQLSGGQRIRDIGVEWVTSAAAPDPALAEPGLIAWLAGLPAPERVLVVRTTGSGDHAGYLLRLIAAPGALTAPAGIDPVLSEVGFSFKAECPGDFDCAPVCTCPDDSAAPPPISYLAKDYASFRRLMLGRMAQTMPGWRETSAADLGITLIEALAYTADRLSYAQDAVGTEAYLATARLRSSIRRHARLVDYRMHDGANARVWVHLDSAADGVVLPAGTRLLTRLPGLGPVVAAGKPARDALALAPLVFETLHAKALHQAENAMAFHEWSDAETCLPRGATRATLAGDFPSLAAGDVLVFEERLGPRSGRPADADPAHRHAVRLTAVQAGLTDELEGAAITEIRWADEDALPFALCLSASLDAAAGGGLVRNVSHALGNIVLADHGMTVADEDLGTAPAPHLQRADAGPSAGGCCSPAPPQPVPARWRPMLAHGPVAQSAPHDPAARSAHAASHPPLTARRPAVILVSGSPPLHDHWQALPDLLAAGPEHAVFVIETEADGRARLRFGDDRGGRRPRAGTRFAASYRVGNGRGGNIGADALAHAITGIGQITGLRNPIAASGGRDPESMEAVRQAAPYAYRRQERAVTAADYAAAARRHPDVQHAAATFRWNGHGHTVFVTIDRFENRPITAEFRAELRAYLNGLRMAGHDLEIDAPRFVALELGLFVCAHPDHFRAQVRNDLLAALSAGRGPDGRPGFFHPDRLGFATPVHLSAIHAHAMAVAGVASVEARRFRRRGAARSTGLADGVLRFGRLEIAQLDNDPNFPERGALEITMGGGK